MNKKIISLLSVLVFILLIIWGYNSLYNPKVVDNINTNVNNQLEEIDTSDWVEYRNEELGISFDYNAGQYNINVGEESVLDEGKKISVVLRDKNSSSIILNIVGTSDDYLVGVGEGCCYDYSDKTLDLNYSVGELEKKLAKYNPINLQKVSIGSSGIEAVEFFGIDEYTRYNVKGTIIIPHNFNGINNLFISGPILISQEGTGQKIFNEIVFKIQNNDFSSEIMGAQEIFRQILDSLEFIN